MNSLPLTYHLIYRPADAREGTSDQVVALHATGNSHQVAIEVRAHPEAIAMNLDACSIEEAREELSMLGFEQFEGNGRRGLA